MVELLISGIHVRVIMFEWLVSRIIVSVSVVLWLKFSVCITLLKY